MKVEYFTDTDGNLPETNVGNASRKTDLHRFSVTRLPNVKQTIPA